MRAPLALFLCLLLAGCQTLPPPSTSNQSGTVESPTEPFENAGTDPSSPAPEPGSTGPVNASLTWARISDACEVEHSQPVTTIERLESFDAGSGRHPLRFRVFGLEQINRWSAVGGSGGRGSVSVSHTSNASQTAIERVLAHEYGHVIQPVDGGEQLVQNGVGDGTTDSLIVRDSIREGIAVYVADTYTTQYLDAPVQSAVFESRWGSWSPGTRLFWAPYYFGGRYVHHRVDSCAGTASIFEDPPRTSEQLLHPEAAREPPVSLDVSATGSTASISMRDRMGELFLRVVFSGQLSSSRAADAATGWGNDRFLSVRTTDGERVFVWILRWDSAADATEFASAFADFRANSSRDYRLKTIDNRTVGVCAGNTTVCEEFSYDTNGTTVALST